eukprot:3773346-Rhodomonas_salina.1
MAQRILVPAYPMPGIAHAAICLCATDTMSGTGTAYGGTCLRAARCPVLRQRMFLSLPYHVFSTDTPYSATFTTRCPVLTK